MAFKKKKQLIVISIDYAKAYDSIRRKEIVNVLKHYKIDINIINNIVEIYKQDQTKIELREGSEINFQITSGIRQGCTLSSTLFKMITFRIMEEIERNCQGVQLNELKINSLFYADDGLILADNKREAENNIKIVKSISWKYGLEINIKKSKVIIFNKKEEIEEIGNIKVEDNIKYLGIKIVNKRNMFQEYIKEQLKKAKKFENMTFGIIEQSCNRLLVGKIFWKIICLPSILYGFNVIKVNEKDIDQLQVIENNVYRKILNAASYTPVGALRGEIGSSSMKTRIIKGKVLYWKSIYERNNDLLKEMIENTKCTLNKEIKNSLRTINSTKEEIINESIETVKEKFRIWDEDMWRKENLKKKSLEIYNANKTEIKEVLYYNERKSMIRFKFKTNTLNLNDRKRHVNEETKCQLCNHFYEDLKHFILNCPKLEEERNKIRKIQRPREENEDKIMGDLLFDENEETEEGLYNLWIKRKILIEKLMN